MSNANDTHFSRRNLRRYTARRAVAPSNTTVIQLLRPSASAASERGVWRPLHSPIFAKTISLSLGECDDAPLRRRLVRRFKK